MRIILSNNKHEFKPITYKGLLKKSVSIPIQSRNSNFLIISSYDLLLLRSWIFQNRSFVITFILWFVSFDLINFLIFPMKIISSRLRRLIFGKRFFKGTPSYSINNKIREWFSLDDTRTALDSRSHSIQGHPMQIPAILVNELLIS